MNSLINDPFLVALRVEREGLMKLIDSFNGNIPLDCIVKLNDVNERISDYNARVVMDATIIETHY